MPVSRNAFVSLQFSLSASICVLCFLTSSTEAQFSHSDIDVAIQGGDLITNQQIYSTSFPTSGISQQFTDEPGIAAEADGMGTIGVNADLYYHVLGPLTYWSQGSFLIPSPSTQIRIENNPPGAPSTIVHPTSSMLVGSAEPPINYIAKSTNEGEIHAHLDFILESTDEITPAFGAYGIEMSFATSTLPEVESNPIYLVFNFGLDTTDYQLALDAFAERLENNNRLEGDFNLNQQLDVEDLQLLTQAIYDQSQETAFDVNHDGLVGPADREDWIRLIKGTYFGDANLDGEFSSADLISVFQVGEYEDGRPGNSTWSEGDFDGDLDFGSSDFVLAFQDGGYESGPRQAVAVPESISLATLWLLTLPILRVARRR